MMIWLLSFMKNYKSIIFPVLMGLAVVAMVYGVYLKGHANGYAQATNESNKEKLKTINENLQIKEKSENIKRPDDDAYIIRLRERSI